MSVLLSNEISLTFLALFLLLLFSFVGGKLFELIKAPKVVGEIFGGMILGGSCIGLLFPEFFNSIFNGFVEEGKVLNIFYQLGLVFLMFSSGFNTNITITKDNFKNYSLLFIGATFFPMLFAIPFVGLFEPNFVGTADNSFAFAIVFLISAAITSIPVISKIFFDIGMMNTKFSNMVLTVSTLQDLCLWILLNLAISIIQTGEFEVVGFIITTALTIGLLFGVKLLEIIFNKYNIKLNKNIQSLSFLITFIIVFLLSKLNINIMYSAFVAGYIMKSIVPQDSKDISGIKDFSMNLFVPIYFALVGIQLDVVHNFSLIRFILFFIVAFGLEFLGTVGTMWFTKLKKMTIFSFGITMNARGGPGIVLATTAFAYDIINIEFFTVLILTTMLSSMIAGYWLRKFKESVKDLE